MSAPEQDAPGEDAREDRPDASDHSAFLGHQFPGGPFPGAPFPGDDALDDEPGLGIHQEHPTLSLDEAALAAAVDRVLAGEGVTLAALSVVLADHATVRDVNRTWLGHDYDTDVVSFPLDEEAAARREVDGEIYVDLDMAAERAPEFGATFEQEALRYVVHGLLHIIGHDDATDDDRAAMRALEDRYLG